MMTKSYDILYARNSNGKINEWSIRVENYPNQNYSRIFINEGLIDGTKTETFRNVLKGKNIGKMNETTPFEQACSEAESRWEKKKKQGYKSAKDLGININILDENGNIKQTTDYVFLSSLETALPQNRTDANNLSKPMKAQPYFDDKSNVRIKFPCLAQPKLNGFRVFARLEKITEGEGIFAQEVIKPTFRSKEGLRYTVLEHIEKDVEQVINNVSDLLKVAPKDIALDGECYIHGEILSEISSAVRKRNPKTEKLEFWVFDIAVENVKQYQRIACVTNIAYILRENQSSIKALWTDTINNNEEAQKYADDCIAKGYEGAIFRDINAVYQFGKRPKTMVKLKRTQDKEFKIVDVVGGDNAPELGIFVCLAENGMTFKVTPEGSHEIKKEYLSNKANYIGKLLTVKFYERTKDNLPFHAVGVTVRDYE